ncbi:hypothetical protein R6V09_05925 [Streptomyces sp. W16]|uniref:hypothetical protein n=1 Tax=Streptomyces sp. W16 TaxID=3076631 RepID=UPI00295B864B|nr:hypothetical protein [Streptomyces sp. W16]MDV9169674.1 hypothetical protein [Streptomyces sp. W16]
MAAMPRGLVNGFVHVLAWLLATGAAVTLSWWGVHTVMTGTAYDPPRALPITAAGATVQEPTPPAEPTVRAESVPSPSSTPTPTRSPSPTPTKTATASPSPSVSTSGQVKSYDTDGGRVVLELDTDPAYVTLVSATPGTGWSMQVWKTDSWLRVEFTKGTGKVSVICTWHDGAPRVDVGNY